MYLLIRERSYLSVFCKNLWNYGQSIITDCFLFSLPPFCPLFPFHSKCLKDSGIASKDSSFVLKPRQGCACLSGCGGEWDGSRSSVDYTLITELRSFVFVDTEQIQEISGLIRTFNVYVECLQELPGDLITLVLVEETEGEAKFSTLSNKLPGDASCHPRDHTWSSGRQDSSRTSFKAWCSLKSFQVVSLTHMTWIKVHTDCTWSRVLRLLLHSFVMEGAWLCPSPCPHSQQACAIRIPDTAQQLHPQMLSLGGEGGIQCRMGCRSLYDYKGNIPPEEREPCSLYGPLPSGMGWFLLTLCLYFNAHPCLRDFPWLRLIISILGMGFIYEEGKAIQFQLTAQFLC